MREGVSDLLAAAEVFDCVACGFVAHVTCARSLACMHVCLSVRVQACGVGMRVCMSACARTCGCECIRNVKNQSVASDAVPVRHSTHEPQANEESVRSKLPLAESNAGGASGQGSCGGGASAATGARAASPVQVDEGTGRDAGMGSQGMSSSIAQLLAAAEANESKVLAAKKPPLGGSVGSGKQRGAVARPSTAPNPVREGGPGGAGRPSTASQTAASLRSVPTPTLTSSPSKVPARSRYNARGAAGGLGWWGVRRALAWCLRACS